MKRKQRPPHIIYFISSFFSLLFALISYFIFPIIGLNGQSIFAGMSIIYILLGTMSFRRSKYPTNTKNNEQENNPHLLNSFFIHMPSLG
ncbi:hypothetical protein [Shouchella miscanthi]|uniref:Uncharacterized protein n=1 Tax=Shouchella miscanthi TaxID=2598861 RepID=A0ABU6NTZ1_9BACI|nr:hypothetical protein [Shouchella miscanthi]